MSVSITELPLNDKFKNPVRWKLTLEALVPTEEGGCTAEFFVLELEDNPRILEYTPHDLSNPRSIVVPPSEPARVYLEVAGRLVMTEGQSVYRITTLGKKVDPSP